MRNKSNVNVLVSHNPTFTKVTVDGRVEDCYLWLVRALRTDLYNITETSSGLVCEYAPEAALEAREESYRIRLDELKASLPSLREAFLKAPDMSHAQALKGVQHPDVAAYTTASASIAWLETELAKLTG